MLQLQGGLPVFHVQHQGKMNMSAIMICSEVRYVDVQVKEELFDADNITAMFNPTGEGRRIRLKVSINKQRPELGHKFRELMSSINTIAEEAQAGKSGYMSWPWPESYCESKNEWLQNHLSSAWNSHQRPTILNHNKRKRKKKGRLDCTLGSFGKADTRNTTSSLQSSSRKRYKMDT